jgi:aldehyde:ferredoxin oxidoreductase
LGIRAVIIEGVPEKGEWRVLRLSKKGASLDPADEYAGMRNYKLAEELYKKDGDKAALITMGVAGERRYTGASIALSGMYGDPSRAPARGGIGVVMGSKGLRAVVIDDEGTDPISIADPTSFRQAVKS